MRKQNEFAAVSFPSGEGGERSDPEGVSRATDRDTPETTSGCIPNRFSGNGSCRYDGKTLPDLGPAG